MSALEELTAAVNDSTKLDTGCKSIVLDFLNAAGPAVAELGPDALRKLMMSLAGGEMTPSVLIESLTPEQVVALLEQTETALAGMLPGRAAQVAASRAAVQGLADAALGILARLILSAI